MLRAREPRYLAVRPDSDLTFAAYPELATLGDIWVRSTPRNTGDLPRLYLLVLNIRAVDILVGPISGAIHIVAATGRPAVAICGGCEVPVNTAYRANTIMLTNAPPCAPCWLREPCPYDRKCLAAISVDAVEAAPALAAAVPYPATGGPGPDG